MMTTSGGISAGHAASYFRRERTKDYYIKGEAKVGTWFGVGARMLGLKGGVDAAEFQRVLAGLHPHENLQLVAGSTAADGKRTGAWDVTFAAPKSVSIVALVGDDARVRAAHEKAVQAALAEVEIYVCGRVRDSRDGVRTGNLVVAQFRHETSRHLDPHLHTHNVCVNLTQRDDGKWIALDSRSLFRAQRLGTSVYRAVLAEQLLSLGYELRHGANGKFEIASISDEQIAHFSQSNQAIVELMKTRNVEGAAAAKQAYQDTKLKKQHVDRLALDREWKAGAAAVGLRIPKPAAVTRANRPLDPSRVAREQRAREAVTYAIAHVSERQAVMTQAAIIEAALLRRAGYVRAEDAWRDLARRIREGEVLTTRADPEVVTTREILSLERELIAMMQLGQGTRAPMSPVDPRQPGQFLRGYDVSDEQRAAALHILTSPDLVIGIQGVAGAGKTRTLSVVKAEAEAAGYVVRGFAPTTRAAAELDKTGIKSTTVTAHLRAPDGTPGRELWIVDEAGLLSTKALHALLRRAERIGARVTLVGDTKQHAAVEAGAPFRLLQNAGMRTVNLREIYRQDRAKVPELHAAVVDASRGKAGRAVERLIAINAVHTVPEWNERHARMAREFVAAPDGTLVIAPSNLERLDLNMQIRERLKEVGRVAAQDIQVQTLRDRGLTGVQRTVAAQYAEGDIIHFNSGSRTLGIARETYGVVVGRDVGRNLLTVMLENRETRTYDPRRLRGVSVYTDETRTFAAGDRVQFRAPIKALEIVNGELGTIVAMDERGRAEVLLDAQPDRGGVAVDLTRIRHVDYGYAVTSYSSQGTTVDKAIIAGRTRHPKELVNNAQAYVSISRARNEVVIYTDDGGALATAFEREVEKACAVEYVDVNLTPAAAASQQPLSRRDAQSVEPSANGATAGQASEQAGDLGRPSPAPATAGHAAEPAGAGVSARVTTSAQPKVEKGNEQAVEEELYFSM